MVGVGEKVAERTGGRGHAPRGAKGVGQVAYPPITAFLTSGQDKFKTIPQQSDGIHGKL